MSGFIGTGLPTTTEDKNVGWVFIKGQKVVSGVASVQFQDGTNDVVMDSTYDEYMFILTNLHPATNDEGIAFQVNASGESGYNEKIGSVFWRAKHDEAGSGSHESVDYVTDYDQGDSGTAYQRLCNDVGNATEESVSGTFTIYEPANAGKVTHFISRMVECHASDIIMDNYVTGYINDTAAIDEISFKFTSGNIDSGTISMFGLVKA